MMKTFALLIPFLCISLLAGEKRVMTPEDVALLTTIGEIAVSPDGKTIAYQKARQAVPFEEDSMAAHRELMVWNESRGSRPYISGDVSISGINWRPGEFPAISFKAKRAKDKHTSLYVIPLDGGEAINVVEHKTSIRSYAWHPNGKTVAFLAKSEASKDKKGIKKKGFNQEAYEEELHNVELYIASCDSEDKPVKFDIDGSVSELHFSPDGTMISVAIAPTSLVDHHYMYRKMVVFNVSDQSKVMELDAYGKMGHASWSPDNKKIAFISGEDKHDPSPGRVFIAEVDSGTLSRHFMTYPGHVSSVTWKDAQTLYFLARIDMGCELGEYRIKDKKRKALFASDDLAVSMMDMQNKGSRLALVASSSSHPSELFTMDLSTKGEPSQLTDSNPILDELQFGVQEIISYKARDGQDIHAILIRPVNEEKGKAYPLIVTVHGGPEAHYSNGFLTRYASPGQVAAGQGYFVLYPNYRGSTGRGLEFSKLSQADAAGKEFDDLVDGVDFLIEKGLVDKDRVGVTGGSYGGYATAWCSTYYSHRFAAGVMFVGISNKISKAGTTDIPDEETLVHARSRPWDKWNYFLERSPVFHVQKAKTPLLILHGKEDPRVHPGQSMELYRHIKTLGQTPVRLVFYPGEGHGNRKSAARYDYNLRMMRWFNSYLKNDTKEKPPVEVIYPLQKDDEEKDDE